MVMEIEKGMSAVIWIATVLLQHQDIWTLTLTGTSIKLIYILRFGNRFMYVYTTYLNIPVMIKWFSSVSHPNGLSALLNGRTGINTSQNREESSSPVSQRGSSVIPVNLHGTATLPNNSYPMGYWSSLNYQTSGGLPNHQLELQSPTSAISNYSLSRNMLKNYNQSNSITMINR